jgi:NADH-quinone oxidoreductase subunit M
MAASSNQLGSSFLGGFGMQKAVFLLLLVGFAAKMPSVPFHTWLPDAHVQAPTAGSMLLAGVMLKMGAYGFIRIAVELLPGALVYFQWLIVILGMVSLVYGALVCLGQTNLKRMVAYSSVSHMGLIFLGIATMQPLGIAGAIFMMLAHGIISPHLFAVCGAFKHHYHTLEIGSMRGIAKHSPWLGGHMMTAWMASLGLPLMAGFVAEIAIMIAFWMTFGWLVILPALTLIITAAYYLWSMQRTIFEGGEEGELPESLHGEDPVDITWHENAGMIILAGFAVLLGILPFIFFDMMSAYSSEFVSQVLLDVLNEVRP